MTKTTRVLSIILEIKKKEDQKISKGELFNLVGNSRAQKYRVFEELTTRSGDVPPLLIKVGDYYEINSEYNL